MSTRLLCLVLFLLLTPALFVPAESANSRIDNFNKTYKTNPMQAIRELCPLDDAKLVDFVIDLWIQWADYGYYFDSAIEDALQTTTNGKPLDTLHKRMNSEDKVAMRAKLMRVVGRMAKPESMQRLIEALKKSNEAVTQVALIEALLGYPPDKVVDEIIPFLDRKYRPDVRLTAVEALGSFKAERALKKIVEMAQKDVIEMRCAAIWALGNIGGKEAESTIIAAIKAPEPPIRAAGCSAAANFPGDLIRNALCDRLKDDRWEVISAAVSSLMKRNEIESVPYLINAMQSAKGRLLDDFQKALEHITEYRFGCDPQNWKDWLEESGGKITRNPTPRPKERPYIVYHTIRTRTLDMVFCIDISGSMNEKVKAEGGYLGEGAVLKGDTKLDYVKAELIRVINSLPVEAKFDIITFAGEATFWRGAQTAADEKSKKAATNFVQTLTADGGTNIYEALQKAFGTLQQKTGYYPHDRSPDTIFLLSDGMPTVGEITDSETLLDVITRINKIRQTTIHTIGVGKEGVPFLKPLAAQNRGEFKLVAQ